MTRQAIVCMVSVSVEQNRLDGTTAKATTWHRQLVERFDVTGCCNSEDGVRSEWPRRDIGWHLPPPKHPRVVNHPNDKQSVGRILEESRGSLRWRWDSCLCHSCLSVLTEINITDTVSLMELSDKLHTIPLFILSIINDTLRIATCYALSQSSPASFILQHLLWEFQCFCGILNTPNNCFRRFT